MNVYSFFNDFFSSLIAIEDFADALCICQVKIPPIYTKGTKLSNLFAI